MEVLLSTIIEKHQHDENDASNDDKETSFHYTADRHTANIKARETNDAKSRRTATLHFPHSLDHSGQPSPSSARSCWKRE